MYMHITQNTFSKTKYKENIIYNRGVITLNIIEALEKLGYQVNLYLFDLSKNEVWVANR